MKFLKILFFFIFFISVFDTVNAQKYFSRTGNISFFSTTAVEDIEAESHSASTVLDMESGKLQWAVLIKSFEFEKSLMQEHFNENYMESSKFPKAKFKGKIVNLEDLDLKSDGVYDVEVEGSLLIHGVGKEVRYPVIFNIVDGNIVGSSEIQIEIEDYEIEIPSVVRDNISKILNIKIKANYELLD